MEYYEAAAKWWADILRNPSLDSYIDAGESVSQIALNLAKECKPTERQINLFEKDLAEEIRKTVDDLGEIYGDFIIICDFEPSYFLQDVAIKYKIHSIGFPFKSIMRINKDLVIARQGHYGKKETIYRRNEEQ